MGGTCLNFTQHEFLGRLKRDWFIGSSHLRLAQRRQMGSEPFFSEGGRGTNESVAD